MALAPQPLLAQKWRYRVPVGGARAGAASDAPTADDRAAPGRGGACPARRHLLAAMRPPASIIVWRQHEAWSRATRPPGIEAHGDSDPRRDHPTRQGWRDWRRPV